MTGAKHDKFLTNFESDDYDETKNTLKDRESDDDDEDEEEIIPDTRQTLVEPSPVFIYDQYHTDHLHRHHRRDESILLIPKDIINSTPVQVNNFNIFCSNIGFNLNTFLIIIGYKYISNIRFKWIY